MEKNSDVFIVDSDKLKEMIVEDRDLFANYLDLLLKSDDNGAIKEAIDIAEEYVGIDDIKTMVRLSRIYFEGLGVDQN